MWQPTEVQPFHEEHPACCIFGEDSKLRRCLDPLLAFALVYGILVRPMRVAMDVAPNIYLWILEMIMDVVIIGDVVMLFRTSVKSSTGDWITDPRTLGRLYLRSWFVVDFVGAVPVDTILMFVYGPNLAGLPMTMSLLRLVRMSQFFRLGRIYQSVAAHMATTASLRLVKLAILILFLTHYMACAWFFVGFHHAETSWVSTHNLRDAPVFDQYVNAFYWAIVTVTTVGYGDIIPANVAEKSLSIFGLMIGVTGFSYAIGTMSYLVQRIEARSNHTEDRLDEIQEYMNYRKFPSTLQARIRDHYRTTYDRIHAHDAEANLLKELSSELRGDVVKFLRSTLLKKNPTFMSCSMEFTLLLISKLRPMSAVAEDVIFREGDRGEEMYFINRGRVELCTGSGRSFSTLTAPDCFGEIAFFTDAGLHHMTARALTSCEFDILTRDDFTELVELFPQEADDLGFVFKAHSSLEKMAQAEEEANTEIYDIDELFARMSHPGTGVPVRDRVHRLRTYPSVLTASELLTWLVDNTVVSVESPDFSAELREIRLRREAASVANMLLNRGYLVRVTYTNTSPATTNSALEDDFSFFRFANALSLTPDQVDEVRKMIAGVEVRDHSVRFTKHKNCFLGCELVDWMMSKHGATPDMRTKMISKCERYMARGAFNPVLTKGGAFCDGYTLYRFNDAAIEHDSRGRHNCHAGAKATAKELMAKVKTSTVDNATSNSGTMTARGLRRPRRSSDTSERRASQDTTPSPVLPITQSVRILVRLSGCSETRCAKLLKPANMHQLRRVVADALERHTRVQHCSPELRASMRREVLNQAPVWMLASGQRLVLDATAVKMIDKDDVVVVSPRAGLESSVEDISSPKETSVNSCPSDEPNEWSTDDEMVAPLANVASQKVLPLRLSHSVGKLLGLGGSHCKDNSAYSVLDEAS